MDGAGIIAMFFPLAPHFVPSHGRKGQIRIQPQGIKGFGMLFIGLGRNILQSDAAHPAHRLGKIPVNDFTGNSDGLKNLASLVRLDCGNPHFGGNFYNTL